MLDEERIPPAAPPGLVETLDRLPPCIVRLVARKPGHHGQRMSLHEIARASGLSYGTVLRLSMKKTWANVPPNRIDPFCKACGVNLLHPSKTRRYLKRVLNLPNGYKLLSAKRGLGCPANVMKLLISL